MEPNDLALPAHEEARRVGRAQERGDEGPRAPLQALIVLRVDEGDRVAPHRRVPEDLEDASALSKLNSWRLLKLIKIKSARSRLYRSRFLQVNTRWKALAEIYTMHSFAPLSNLKIFVKNR